MNPAPPLTSRHRLRHLAARERLVAGLLALALLMAPAVALAQFLPDWAPTSDNAFIALRAFDVGTSRTPLTGQPSFSAYYGGDEDVHVDHPGAVHFYVLAPFVRMLGTTVGMLLVSALVAGGTALMVVWVVLRQLGSRAAVVSCAVMALVMFTRGAGSLTNPLSSSFSGYLLLGAAVLVWALLCGDDRLLPLTAGVVSFGAQVHLAVGPTMVFLALTALGAVVVVWWRQGIGHDHAVRRRAARLGAVSVGLVVLLWAPVVSQQLFGNHPNLSALWRYMADSNREDLGASVAIHQLVNVLGWPPLLGRTQLTGFELLREPARSTWLSAAVTVGGLVLGGIHWWRRGRTRLDDRSDVDDQSEVAAHRRSLLVVMIGLLMLAGYVNGSGVPVGLEQGRLAFYHWIWPLTFFTTVAAVLLVFDAGDWLVNRAKRRRVNVRGLPGQPGVMAHARAVAVGGVVVVMAALPLANTRIDRPTNTLTLGMDSALSRQPYESLADQIVEHRDALPSPTLLLTRGQFVIGGHHSALAVQLEERGLPVVHSGRYLGYVADGRIVDVDNVDAALLQVVSTAPGGPETTWPGRQLARYEIPDPGVTPDGLDEVEVFELTVFLVTGDELDELLDR